MARKNLLSGLMADAPDPSDGSELTAVNPPRRAGGALGAVGKSFAQMRASSVAEIPADLIDGAGLEDRLGEDPDLEALAQSLREYGQQVPVLVRHSANFEGRYEIVYGRRRVAALKKIGQPVRAMVRDLADRELIVAQGQENTARINLSFIEKANFARQMLGSGFDRKVICDALSVDKTVVSKLLKVADSVPHPLIRAIGAAPNTGRDRWLTFAAALRDPDAALAATDGLADSDARFEAALASTRSERPVAPKASVETHDWGRVNRGVRGTTVAFGTSPFGDWLVRHLDELHARWAEETETETKEE